MFYNYNLPQEMGVSAGDGTEYSTVPKQDTYNNFGVHLLGKVRALESVFHWKCVFGQPLQKW